MRDRRDRLAVWSAARTPEIMKTAKALSAQCAANRLPNAPQTSIAGEGSPSPETS